MTHCSEASVAVEKALLEDVFGVFGEMAVAPDYVGKKGFVMPIEFECDGEKVLLYSLGRYFGKNHYMNQLHPYSAAIKLNKYKDGKAYGVFNERFAELFSKVLKRVDFASEVHCICSVPARPGEEDRFQEIIEHISGETSLEPLNDRFVCVRDYPTQKERSGEERTENIKDVFQFNGKLDNKNVVIIDDVISTGATIRECIRVLKAAGAQKVVVCVLAINQLGGSYWSSNPPIVKCPQCQEKMKLKVNSKKRAFFYSCYPCRQNLNYLVGRRQVIEKMNDELLGDDYENDTTFLM